MRFSMENDTILLWRNFLEDSTLFSFGLNIPESMERLSSREGINYYKLSLYEKFISRLKWFLCRNIILDNLFRHIIFSAIGKEKLKPTQIKFVISFTYIHFVFSDLIVMNRSRQQFILLHTFSRFVLLYIMMTVFFSLLLWSVDSLISQRSPSHIQHHGHRKKMSNWQGYYHLHSDDSSIYNGFIVILKGWINCFYRSSFSTHRFRIWSHLQQGWKQFFGLLGCFMVLE